MTFILTPDLLTGIAELDAQHRALFGQFNELIAACREKRGSEEVGQFLTFLTGYVHRHFDDEEREMARISYPGLDRHRGEHEKYRKKLADLKERVSGGTVPNEVAEDALWLAAEWFVDHIRQVDMAMAAALRSQKN